MAAFCRASCLFLIISGFPPSRHKLPYLWYLQMRSCQNNDWFSLGMSQKHGEILSPSGALVVVGICHMTSNPILRIHLRAADSVHDGVILSSYISVQLNSAAAKKWLIWNGSKLLKRDSGADSSEAKLDFARKKSLLQNVIDSARKIGQNGINKKWHIWSGGHFGKKDPPYIISRGCKRCAIDPSE